LLFLVTPWLGCSLLCQSSLLLLGCPDLRYTKSQLIMSPKTVSASLFIGLTRHRRGFSGLHSAEPVTWTRLLRIPVAGVTLLSLYEPLNPTLLLGLPHGTATANCQGVTMPCISDDTALLRAPMSALRGGLTAARFDLILTEQLL